VVREKFHLDAKNTYPRVGQMVVMEEMGDQLLLELPRPYPHCVPMLVLKKLSLNLVSQVLSVNSMAKKVKTELLKCLLVPQLLCWQKTTPVPIGVNVMVLSIKTEVSACYVLPIFKLVKCLQELILNANVTSLIMR